MVGSASATKDPEDTLHTSGLRWLGLAVGAIAFLLALLAPGTLSAIPLSGLAINIALLAGLLCLFLVLFEGHGPWFGDRLLAVLFPVLAAAVLARLFVMDPGTSQAIVLRESGGYEVGSVALALLAIRGLERGLGWCAGRAFWAVGIGGGATAGLLLARHAQLAWPMVPGAGTILLLTAALVVAALVLQSTLARRSRNPRIRVLAGWAGLAVAAGHLLDGTVSYLAVADPLDLMDRRLVEGVFLSRLILSTGGPLFPLLKWGVAAGAVSLSTPTDAGEEEHVWWHRTALLLVVMFLGLGPGLFSSLQVLYA